jgi:uncharacterized protein (DUF2062 family)
MREYARRYFRRKLLQAYRYLKHPRRLKRNRLLHWFALHFLDKHVWRPTQHTLAGGLAVGMFVTSILFPGQMPVAVVLAGLFRVNVPIAIVACWLSNPVTFAPMIVAEVRVGEWFLHLLGMQSDGHTAIAKAHTFLSDTYHGLVPWSDLWHRFYELLTVAKELYVGAAVVATVLAISSYLIAYGLWAVMAARSRLPGGIGPQ